MPQVLVDKGLEWTTNLIQYISNDFPIPENLIKHYRDPSIKDTVKTETSGKCLYCESRISHVYYGDVEHILPKSIFPELTFAWENLSFVCAKCNGFKKDYFHDTEPLVNPYQDSLNEHFQFVGPLIVSAKGSRRAQSTIALIKLNRSELIERRSENLLQLQRLIDKYHQETDHKYKELWKGEIIDCLDTNVEYSAFVKARVTGSDII